MDTGNVVIDSDMAYPILFIPKKCTTLETNCELTDNVYIDVSITSPDTEGNNTNIYNGFCNVKLVDSYDVNLNRYETPESSTAPDIDQMPVILSEGTQNPPYSQSQVWIDPSRSPYVYNHYNPSNQEQYSIRESGGLITVEQHNTYITQNVYNCKESNVYNYKESQTPVKDFGCRRYRRETVATASDTNLSYYEEDEFECGVFLSQLPEEILNVKQTRARGKINFSRQENNALKQLMSSDIQSTSKQRKTILFLGNDSHSGHTLQNISYNDPLVKCAEIEVDNEVVIDTSSPNLKKKYQCDKCKQIFDQISSFRQHMVGNHTNIKLLQPAKDLRFVCNECGKNLKTLKKFELHCSGHGDPDLECPKCRKVFASKFSLRVHMKIHSRKYSCNFCIKSYGSFLELKTHVEKIHHLFMCEEKTCSFASGKASDLELHQHWNKTEVDEIEVTDTVFNDPDEFDDPDDPEETELKSEAIELDQDLMSSSQFMRSTHDLSTSNQDLSTSNQDCEMSNQDCKMLNQDCEMSNQNCKMLNQDCEVSNQDCEMLNQDCEVSNQDCKMSNQDCEMSNQDCEISNQDCKMSNQVCEMSNQDCKISNQDLSTSNQDCEMSNQDCKMSNQDCDISNQDLSTSNQDCELSNQVLSTSNQDCELSNQNLAMSNNQMMKNEDLAMSNQDLAMSNQELLTSNQNLAISEQDLAILKQDLAMSNQDLSMSKQDLAMSNQDLLTSNQDLPTSNQNLVISKHDLAISKQDLAMSNQDLLTSNQNLALSEQDLTILKQDLAMSNQDLSMSKQDLAMFNQDLLTSNQNLAISKQDLVISNQDLAMSNQDLLTSNQNLAISEQDMAFLKQDLAMSKQDLAMSNQELSACNPNLALSKQDLAISKQDLAMSNQDLLTSNQNLAISKQDLVMSNQDFAMSNQDLPTSNQDLPTSNQNLVISKHDLMISKQDLAMSNHDLSMSKPTSNQNLVISNQDLAGSSNDLLSSQNSRSIQDQSRSSLNLARSHEDPTAPVVENDGDRIRKADSVIAKVMTNTIFLLSTKKARRHRCRRACEVCLKPFDRIDDLKRHLIEHVIRSTLAKTPVSRAGRLSILCEVCQTATFEKVDKYKAHLREHAKLTIYKCTFCDKSFSDSSNFSKHKKIHGASFFQCDLCNRKFNSKKMISQHMEYHRTHLPIHCSVCSKSFHFASMLNKHVRCAHRKTDASKYRCRFCDDIFRTLKEKWDHEWRVHNVRKLIVDCLICGSKYRKYSELKRHCIEEHEVDIPPAKKLKRKRFARKISFD